MDSRKITRKCPRPPKATYRVTAILIKIPATFFTETDYPLICLEPRKTPKSQNDPEKTKLEAPLDPMHHYVSRSYRNRNSVFRQQAHRSVEQKRPGTDPHALSYLSTRELRTRDEDGLLNKWCWESWTDPGKRMKMDSSQKLTPNGPKI